VKSESSSGKDCGNTMQATRAGCAAHDTAVSTPML
jgi:hypothetical protein